MIFKGLLKFKYSTRKTNKKNKKKRDIAQEVKTDLNPEILRVQ